MHSIKQKGKIIFLGTPEFGANVLQQILLMGYQPILVVCQPDNKKNRKKEVIFSPVKQLALKHNLNLVQPKQIIEIFPLIQQLQPDLLLTAAYGQFVPEKILQLFPLGG